MASFRMVMVAGETVRTERSSNKMRRAQELGWEMAKICYWKGVGSSQR